MRHHFHRCGHLRVVGVDISDLSGARKGGSQILEELCEARGLARCVGLAECDVLSAAQKRDLLAARATRLREEEGGSSPLADLPDPRAAEFQAFQRDLRDERERIAEPNRRRVLEATAALKRNPRPLGAAEQSELAAAGISIFDDQDLRELRSARLDAIDRHGTGSLRRLRGLPSADRNGPASDRARHRRARRALEPLPDPSSRRCGALEESTGY